MESGINALLAGAAVGSYWWLLGRVGVERLRDRLWLAVLLGFSTQILWITTRGEGLLAFDGKSFRHLRPDIAEHRKALPLVAERNGRILFGTERAGVLVFDGTRVAALHPGLGSLNVTALAGDESDLWIGTLDRGVARFRAGEIHWIGALPDQRVTAIVREADRVFAATPLGVAEIRNDRVLP